MKTYIEKLAASLFNDLKSNEELRLEFHSEESDFIRFNKTLVRQNTHVKQHELTLTLLSDTKTYSARENLTLDFVTDEKNLINKLNNIRGYIKEIDVDPNFAKLTHNGTSSVNKPHSRPSVGDMIKEITDVYGDVDLAGFLSAGPIRKASLNSLGQNHFFENDNFFFDYSLYNGPKAAKGYYASDKWDSAEFKQQALNTKNTLSLLNKPAIKLKPNQYKTFLGPMALNELIDLMNWGTFSYGKFKQGSPLLKRLESKEQLLSPKLSLYENNDLGFNTHFNSLGELSPNKLTIIENGELKNLLISQNTGVEYKVESNKAEPSETLRSVEVRAGALDQNQILKELNTGLYLNNLHYLNWSDLQSARFTGMTRFASLWVENGEIVGPIEDMRFDDSIYSLLGTELIDFTEQRSAFLNTATYLKRYLGGVLTPGALVNKMNFTL